MKVLVTGANGHIGANVVRELLNQGYAVRGFVRANADLRGLEGLDVEIVNGDVTNVETLKPAAEGIDAIIHLAAVYKTIAETAEEIVAPAVSGSENIFKVAQHAGIKRIVYTSSIASIGFSDSPEHMRTGEDWNDDAQNPYYVAKTKSEQIAHKLSRASDIELIVLCPAIVLGPHDYRITPSNQLVKDWLNGKGQTYRGGLNLVYVGDVARAHVAALHKGENRRRYIVGGENIEVKQIGKILKQLTGTSPLHLPTSRGVTLVFAAMVEKLSRLLGIKPLFTRDLIYEVVERYGFYDCTETYKTFDLQPRDATASLKSAIEWLMDTGHIRQGVVNRAKRVGKLELS